VPYALFFVLLALDQVSKFATQHFLPLMSHSAPWYPYGGIGVFQNFLGIEFSINHATNRGAAWGAFAEYAPLLMLLRLGLIAGLLIYFLKARGMKKAALSMILAGAIGNVIDVFIYGHVIDMFHFVLWGYDYPVFNVADSAIFCGVILYFLASKREKHASDAMA
jgi:signal peptidase II